MSSNGKAWRLRVQLPAGYEDDHQALFEWLRTFLIPACLNAPMGVTLVLEPPDVRGFEEDSEPPQ